MGGHSQSLAGPSLKRVSSRMSYSRSSKALERGESTISLSLWPVVSSLRELRSSLEVNLISKYDHPSLGVSELFFPFDFPACLDSAQPFPKTVLSLSQLLLPTLLAALKIIPFFFLFPHGITTVRAHLERLSPCPWSRSSRHCFQTQSWLFCKHSLEFLPPRGIPFNLAGLKASCWTMTS